MEIYRLFFDNIPLPIWIEDVNERILFLNKAYEELYDINYEEVKGKSNKEIFDENTYTKYSNQIQRCIKTLQISTYIGKIKGAEKQCHMFPLISGDGNVEGVAGIVVDVTLEKLQHEELQNQKNILRTIIDSLPEVIFYKDNQCRYVGYNKQFGEFYERNGLTEIMGKTDVDICSDAEAAVRYMEEDLKIMATGESVYLENVFVDDNGNRYFEESLKVPVMDDTGYPWGIVGLSRDITSRKLLEEKLMKLSYTDNLTGLYNRTYFEEKLNELNSKTYLPLAIIMGDVNGLKVINDSFGHLEGDRLIKEIAFVLDRVCGSDGFVFRWGGDEFMILMPKCDEKRCDGIIEKIQKECNKREFSYIKLSIALGSTVKYSQEENDYMLIKDVEEMVYRQKLLERDSVTSAMLRSLQKSLEAKDTETEEHCTRVEEYALAIGKLVGMKISELHELKIAARLHDIGKIAIDEEILLKSGSLTSEEFEIIKSHTEKGYRIINASSMLGNVAKCVLTHHERWDGTGYPIGISGEEIPLMARIVAIADAYDVMTHDRVYKKARSKEEAISELVRCSGKQFDPNLVDLFIKNEIS